MSSKPNASDFTRAKLPWVAAAALFVIYVVTLNQWVSVRSLGAVSKITGWDWVLPTQWPVFYTLTYPFRFLSGNAQLIGINLLSAIFGALTIALLVRSVALLPHDRTDEQRIRARSQEAFLATGFAWAPCLLAAAAFGLQLTMWENSTAATNEALDVFIFAYLIRCLLEYRVSKNDRWIWKLALIYGIGVTNNWALIGFFPFFVIALIWIKGKAFFKLNFIAKATGLGLLGLLFYLVLPAAWMRSGDSEVTFWEVLRSHLVEQKQWAFHPALRARALILSLTSIVPVVIMGIRFPAGFGDVSSAGASITNVMFRAVHLLFAAVCVYIAFDPPVSPRRVGLGIPFLTFYYLGALAIGYYVGYAMLVFTDPPKKHWRPVSPYSKLINPVVQGLAWLAVGCVPLALMVKNFKPAYAQNGKLLQKFAETIALELPSKPAILLTDDANQLAILEAWFGAKGGNPHILLNSRSLPFPAYHKTLVRRYGARWPSGGAQEDPKARIPPFSIVSALNSLATSNAVYYLHPSFGYYFEVFYPNPVGLISELKPYPTNVIFRPKLDAKQIEANELFWKANEAFVDQVESLVRKNVSDASYIAFHLSRAENTWATDLQRVDRFKDATKYFESAVALNTNNLPAAINLTFNRSRVSGKGDEKVDPKAAQELFARTRGWDQLLTESGSFDVPEYLYAEGHAFLQQSLVRQASESFKRSSDLDPTNAAPKLALASALIQGKWLDEANNVVASLQSATNTTPSQRLDLISMEAAIYFGRHDTNRAEQILLGAMDKYPRELSFYDSLNELYRASGQWKKSVDLLGREMSLAPTNLVLRMQRADMALNAGDTNTVLSEIAAILKVDPNNRDAAMLRTFVAIQQKDYPKALATVEEVLQRNDRDAQAWIYKGIAYMESKDDVKAIDAFSKALKIDREAYSALQNRAIVNTRANHLKEARKDYERLQEAFPMSYQVYFGLGDIAAKSGDKDEAVKNFELYLKYAPTNAVGEAEQERNSVEARLKELRGGK